MVDGAVVLFGGCELIIAIVTAVCWYAIYCIRRDMKNGRDVSLVIRVIWGLFAGASSVVLIKWSLLIYAILFG